MIEKTTDSLGDLNENGADDKADLSLDDHAEHSFEPSQVMAQERKIGRYELVYGIGEGGMANVFLARSSGPAGFHKWFAIKRIHKHLAKDKKFVQMFLDEARIAAAIEHQNVAHVFDLGEADGNYFIAMEYLHGESLFGVARAAIRAGACLEPRLAAYIIARALDGLHYAHEATGPSGNPLNVVHRDVSPQNIFVTYDGQVKLTDFGVAKAANRITHTETGLIKGKLAYSSPEQLRGSAVDRRTDIFAMAICLWEISTGRRLFKGNNSAETLYRISSGYRRPAIEVMPDYPQELDQIIQRGLAHDRSDRYATADDFARDLDRFVARNGDPIGSREIKGLMHTLFPEQIEAKEEILKRPVRFPDEGDSSSRHDVEPSESRVRTIAAASEDSSPRPSPSWNMKTALGLFGLLAILMAGGFWALKPTPTPTANLRIDTTPHGAALELDGVALDQSTPALLEEIPYGEHNLRITLSGHVTQNERITVDEPRVNLAFALQPQAPPEPSEAEGPAEPPEVVEAEAPIEPAPETPSPTETAEAPPTERRPTPDRERLPRSMTEMSPRTAGTATLNLLSTPSARVSINGRAAGNTPLYRATIPSGTVRIRLTPAAGEGSPQTITLRGVQPGANVSRRVDLR